MSDKAEFLKTLTHVEHGIIRPVLLQTTNDILSCLSYISKSNSVVYLEYGSTLQFFSDMTTVKYQHCKDVLTAVNFVLMFANFT